MHSPSQSLWSSDGEEVHSVTLENFFSRLLLFIGIGRTITVLLVLRARYWRGGPAARRSPSFLRVDSSRSEFLQSH